MNPGDRVYVAGHHGLVGSALVRRLRSEGFDDLLLQNREELDLTDRRAVEQYFREARPQYVFLAAARVGGIMANWSYPADFIRDNLAIGLNVVEAAHSCGVGKLLFLGSSCIYPKHAPQPMKEEYLLTGALEPTNEPYAVAKIAGIKLCQAYARQYGARFVSIMPTNLYGPGDNFDLETSHVLAALIRKFHDAKAEGADRVVVWGTGSPRREFLYVDDLADACVFAMRNHDDPQQILNVGTGRDITIRELAELIASIAGYEGEIVYDTTKPDGMPRKLLDVSRIEAMGWRPATSLRDGIRKTLQWYASAAVGSAPAVIG
jgi:GDP-L-fucose synthase